MITCYEVAKTGSMEPYYRGGEIVIIDDTEFDDLKIGDIVIIWWQGKGLFVIHAILNIRRASDGSTSYVTKGYANKERDPHLLTRENYRGRVAVTKN